MDWQYFRGKKAFLVEYGLSVASLVLSLFFFKSFVSSEGTANLWQLWGRGT